MREKNDPMVQAFGENAVNEWDLGWDEINRNMTIDFQEISIFSQRHIQYTFSTPAERFYRKYLCLIYGHSIVNTRVEKNSYCKCCLKTMHEIEIKKSPKKNQS